MIYNLKFVLRTFLIFSVFIFNTSPLMAVAFPFREFNVGDPVPDVTLYGFKDAQKKVTFSYLKGQPFVVVFWGADIEEKMDRSAKTLQGVETLSPFFQQKKVKVFSVNIQGDVAPVIEQVVNQSQSNIDVYVDQDRKAYAALGIFIMPTILLVDKEGKVAEGMGYSHDIVDRLKGAVEVMLGEKTPEQVMAELRPEMKEIPEQEKKSRRHMDFGIVMRKRGQLEISIRELTKAIEIDPGLTQAHFELGCIYLEKGQLDNAEKAFDQALEKDPGSLRGRICKTKLKREKGQAEEAVKDLQVILQEYPEAYDALYTLGRAFEDLHKMQEAMDAYKKAYTSIQKSVASEE